ncbi:MAG TPA: tRNA (guanosine(46)-N7)-methyltransferase TrmB [Phycisphaerae bacterium]|nr:tRNA (guanosine(46)-N7)-methyltransferase TrmB [Phycisphaerae bacterium]
MALRPNLICDPVLLHPDDPPIRLDWKTLFGNDNPVELEIGSGKGTFLLAAAMERPKHNFIGIEWAKAYCAYAADRLRRHGCLNCRMVRAEAFAWVRGCIPDESIAAVHIYFPDPWPKLRHHKRRLIQPAFLDEVRRILIPGSKLRIKTDHANYFEHIQHVLGEYRGLQVIAFDSPLAGIVDDRVDTNFERKYRVEKRDFFSIAALKA